MKDIEPQQGMSRRGVLKLVFFAGGAAALGSGGLAVANVLARQVGSIGAHSLPDGAVNHWDKSLSQEADARHESFRQLLALIRDDSLLQTAGTINIAIQPPNDPYPRPGENVYIKKINPTKNYTMSFQNDVVPRPGVGLSQAATKKVPVTMYDYPTLGGVLNRVFDIYLEKTKTNPLIICEGFLDSHIEIPESVLSLQLGSSKDDFINDMLQILPEHKNDKFRLKAVAYIPYIAFTTEQPGMFLITETASTELKIRMESETNPITMNFTIEKDSFQGSNTQESWVAKLDEFRVQSHQAVVNHLKSIAELNIV